MSEDLLNGFVSENNTQTTETQTDKKETAYEKAVKVEESLEDEFTRLLKEFIAESEQKNGSTNERNSKKVKNNANISNPVPKKINNNQEYKSVDGYLEEPNTFSNLDAFISKEAPKQSSGLDDFLAQEETKQAGGLDDFITQEETKQAGGLDDFITQEETKQSSGLDDFITQEETKQAGGLDDFITQEEPQASTGLEEFITPEIASSQNGMFKDVSPVYTKKMSTVQTTLKQEEFELSRAVANFQDGIRAISKKKNLVVPKTDYNETMLQPNYKPSVGKKIATHLLECWDLLNKYDPENMQRLPNNASDEQFLVFAESLKDTHLQLVIISYVEILINLEICEVKYAQKKEIITKNRIKKELYEEYMRLQERKNIFIKKLKEQNFPIDVDKLMNNYFRAAQKDTKGAFNALTKNPAMFSPIQFEKIKPRFFGLIKVTPEDGIKMNQKIGEFIKKLKV